MDAMDTNQVLFSGYARLPSGTVASEMFGVMALVILVNIKTGEIIEAECTLSTRMAERLVAKILVGRNLKSGPQEIIELINHVYQGTAKKAIITALRNVYDKYQAFVS